MIDVHSHLGFLKQLDGSMSKGTSTAKISSTIWIVRPTTGFAAAISMGTDRGELTYMREEVIPGAALFRTMGRGLAWPGSGPFDPARNDVPYASTTLEQAKGPSEIWRPRHPDSSRSGSTIETILRRS